MTAALRVSPDRPARRPRGARVPSAGWSPPLGPPRGGRGRYSASPTMAGVIFVGALGVILLAALNASVNLLFLVIGLGLGVLVASFATSRAAVRRLHVTRQAPDAVLALRPFVVRYRVTNGRAYGAAYALRIRERIYCAGRVMRVECYVPVVPARQSVTVDVAVAAPCRGRLHFGRVSLTTRYPFGLFERRLTVWAEHQTVVFPALLAVRRRLLGRSAFGATAAPTAREERHGHDEFYGLREYRHGDSLKRVHWRRSARTGQLLVREMTDVSPQCVVVVLDTHLPPTAQEADRERAISAAATVIRDALEQGHRLAVIAASSMPLVVPPTTGRGLRARLLSQLALMEGGPAPPAARFLAGLRWRGNWRGRGVLLAAAEYPGLAETAEQLRRRVGTVEVVTASGPEFDLWFGTPDEHRTAAPRARTGVGA